jgi:hypothetical protein
VLCLSRQHVPPNYYSVCASSLAIHCSPLPAHHASMPPCVRRARRAAEDTVSGRSTGNPSDLRRLPWEEGGRSGLGGWREGIMSGKGAARARASRAVARAPPIPPPPLLPRRTHLRTSYRSSYPFLCVLVRMCCECIRTLHTYTCVPGHYVPFPCFRPGRCCLTFPYASRTQVCFFFGRLKFKRYWMTPDGTVTCKHLSSPERRTCKTLVLLQF